MRCYGESPSVTVALPRPMVSASAVSLDSWHISEQSGRLLLPNCRANNWQRNAASLLVRAEV